jgi:hypothetical protein
MRARREGQCGMIARLPRRYLYSAVRLCALILWCWQLKDLSKDLNVLTEHQAVLEEFLLRPSIDTLNSSTTQSSYLSSVQMTTGKIRHKAHWCHWWAHMGRPMEILQTEFGFNTTVEAQLDPEWDIIFGGYPHCGSENKRDKDFDWDMRRGLNAHLNKQGWDTLKPHQVWFPCMGCADSYCNKRGLCSLVRSADPDSCYLLPQDLHRIKAQMLAKPDQKWVLKRDANNLHLHTGNGVWFIQNVTQLPTVDQMTDATYLVQPFVEQYLGQGNYHRRHELKLFLTVTSTSPLRVYAYNQMWGNLAFKTYNKSAATSDICMLDTHGDTHGKCKPQGLKPEQRRALSFEHIASKYQLGLKEQSRFDQSARELIAKVILEAHPVISAHKVNQGITKSKAMCFSFMRADLAIAENGEASLYEINEFPFANDKVGVSKTIQEDAYRDLFRMVGLDMPPIPVEKRAEYELSHLGGWHPLIIDGKISSTSTSAVNVNKSPVNSVLLKGADEVVNVHQCEQRQGILRRAQEWANDGIKYDFHNFYKGYRAQCSGFVSFVLNLTVPNWERTPRCYEFEKKGHLVSISKNELQPGDIMVCNINKNPLPANERPRKALGQQIGGHCLLFDHWVNASKTAYIGWENCDDATCHDATRRLIPYPYFYKPSCWEPMRFKGLEASC